MVSLFLVFVLAVLVCIFYGIALLTVFEMIFPAAFWKLRRWRKASTSDGPGYVPAAKERRIRQCAVLVIASLGVVVFAYSLFVEPYWPEVVAVELKTDKLPAAASPIRIALIADTHSDPKPRLEERLPEIIQGLKPDLIVFAGDAQNSAAGIIHFRECMSRLAKIAPTYAVLGNWEVWWFPDYDQFGKTGVKLLNGDVQRHVFKGAEVLIAGFPVLNGRRGYDKGKNLAEVKKVFAAVSPEKFLVFVHHYPEVAALAVEQGADLGLAGDTHGGQVRLPFIGPLVRISRFGGYFDIGAHRIAEGMLYVNRGIGMEGSGAPRVRFRCRPEVTLFTIRGQDSSNGETK